VRTKWNYERTTDAASYTHSEDEVQINEHAIGLKHLWTDAAYYSPGQSVRLFAEVMTPREEAQGAADFHVVAQVVQPDEQAKRSVVLAQVPYSEPRWHCVSFECDTPGTGYCTDYPRGAVTFHAPATRLNRVVDVYPLGGDGQSELVLFDGHAVTLPSVAEVTVELVPISNPITVRALSGGTEVSRQTTTGAPLTSTSVTLSTTSGLIDRLEFHGTAAAGLLLKLCYFKPISRIVKSSYYQGSFTLDARAPLGCYKCYLYVQTVNNVPPGTDPALAAQTIGGLPASQNLTSQPTAGGGCAFCMVLDYSFHVIQPEPPPIH
jgi:hypothetical protein